MGEESPIIRFIFMHNSVSQSKILAFGVPIFLPIGPVKTKMWQVKSISNSFQSHWLKGRAAKNKANTLVFFPNSKLLKAKK